MIGRSLRAHVATTTFVLSVMSITAVTFNDELMWYRHDGRSDGRFTWAAPEGKKVGTGWVFKDVFSGERPGS